LGADALDRVLQKLRGSLDPDPRSDSELLAHLRRNRDPSTIATIVYRHGPRVLAACRKVLGRAAEVEDAFQATFLVLLRNPAVVRRAASLGAWLFGVAHRISLKTRARGYRRESPLEDSAVTEPDLSWREACAILQVELDRLPDRLRLPLALCYLDGKSRDEAANELGRSLNSVKKALETGREALRKRLIKRSDAVGRPTGRGRGAGNCRRVG
jgi:RNA polymerase sigma factor (sigma-70 family)